MKKLLALIVALMLALTCTSAFAQTVVTQVTIDRDLAKEMLPAFGVPEEQLGMVDAVLAVVNALGVRVTTVADGAQVDLSLNDADALSLGWATDDAGAGIVSTLFPNYYLTIQNETIAQMMEQMSANMSGAGGEGGAGGMDMAAMGEVFGKYFAKWMEACAAAGQPGEPESVQFEYENYVFDTLVPVTVDMDAIRTATQTLMDELLADEEAIGMLKGMMQNMPQAGATAEAPDFEAQFKAGFEEWMAHFPDTVTAELYTNSDGSEPFYMIAESAYEGSEAPFFTCYMLYENAQNMDMGFAMDVTDEETSETATMTAGFAMKDTDMKMYFDMAGMYLGLNISAVEPDVVVDVFFMNPDKPLLSVKVEITDDGDRTLPVEADGKTTLAVEEIMTNGNSAAAQGLYGDIQANGLGAVLGVAMQQVPELGQLMGALSGQMAG